MYVIYADGAVLYAPHLVQEGCGVLSPKLTVEVNKAGALEYTLPPNNVLYDAVSKLKSIVTLHQNGVEKFRGRVLHDEKDFWLQKKTYCEGELSFLLDSKQRPYSFTGTLKDLFAKYISEHNSRVDAAKHFTVGEVTVSCAEESITVENFQYPNTLDEISNQLINVYGGYLVTRGNGDTRYIDWLAESGGTCSQTIEFGRNLLDITEHVTAEDVYTVLIPLGATDGNTEKKLTIESVNDGKDYLEDETAIALFGRIEKTLDFSEVKDAGELKTLGETALSRNIELAVTLSLKAVDLRLLGVDVDQIEVGCWVRVISLPHGLDKLFQCTKIAYDLVSPDQNEYVFGVNFSSLTDKQIATEKNANSAASTVRNAVSVANVSATNANQAAANAEQVIASMPNTYVTREEFNALSDRVTKLGG